MEAAQDRFRLAIAALEVPGKLHDALADLHGHRFAASDLCLAGTPAVIDVLRGTGIADGHPLLPPLLHVEPLPFIVDAAILATSNRPLTTLPAAGPTPNGTTAMGGCWLAPSFRVPLMERMRDGDVVLMAGPLTAEQLTVGTRVLLRHSRHRVQSHLLIPPGR